MTSLKLPEGVNLFSVKKGGVKRLEIVPYEVTSGANPDSQPGDLYFQRTFWTHRGVGANNDTYICPQRTAGQRCPICEERARLDKAGDTDPELLKDLLPKKRQLWNVYDHSDPDRGVQVWDISYWLFGKQLFARITHADEEDEYEWFADPDDGFTLKVGFTEKQFAGNTYTEAETIDFKLRAEGLDPDILDAANDLDGCLVVEDYDKLASVFFHTRPAEPEPQEDAAPPEAAKRKRATKKKAAAKKQEPEPAPEPEPEPVAAPAADAGGTDEDWDEDWD
jgi:pyruvate/2-oxoglutarate dehydrogenase complex dihydrolipoamide acyltransferase (E2) component